MNSAYSQWQALLLCVALTLPLTVALLIVQPTVARRVRALDLAAWSALPACLLVIVLPDGYVDLNWLLLGSRFGIDATGRVFLGFTAFLWLTGGVFARGYFRGDAHARRFFAFYALSMAGNLGLVLALDVVGFFVFFTLMSFAAYGLVVHEPTPENVRAGRIYIVLAIAGEVLLFSALVLLGSGGDSMQFPLAGKTAASVPLVMVLVILAFGIKAGALPVHVWLPLAHPAAPTPASAVLSGAMIKAGLLGWLRFLPLGESAQPDFGAALVIAGAAAAFYGVALGLVQQNPKTVLAYSSISQMGFMTAALGLGLAVPEAWPALLAATLVYAVHHGFAKGALFLGVGVMAHTGRRMVVLSGMGFAALALAGAPLTSGAVAKSMLKDALPAAYAPIATLWSVAAIGTTLLMARLLLRVTAGAHSPGKPAAWLWLAWSVSLAAVAVGVLLVPDTTRGLLETSDLLAGVWPVAIGLALAYVVWRLVPGDPRLPGWLRVPAGDVLVPVEIFAMRLLAALKTAAVPKHRLAGLRASMIVLSARTRASLLRIEDLLNDWVTVGLCLLGLVIILFLLLAP